MTVSDIAMIYCAMVMDKKYFQARNCREAAWKRAIVFTEHVLGELPPEEELDAFRARLVGDPGRWPFT